MIPNSADWMVPNGGGTGGGRTTLRQATSFNITVGGSDVTGDGSIANPWATTQHAQDLISGSYDLHGQVVTVNIGAGTFAGWGVKSTVGGGVLQWLGAGAGSTIIQRGPNDGTFNQGQPFSVYTQCGSNIKLDGMTFDAQSGVFVSCLDILSKASIFLGIPGGPSLIELKNGPTNSGFGCIRAIGNGTYIENDLQDLNITPGGASLSSVLHAESGATINCTGNRITVSGNPAWTSACVAAFDISLITVGQTWNGTATGTRYDVEQNSVIDSGGSGANLLPGSVAGTAITGGQYI